MNKKHDFLLYSFLLILVLGSILYIFKFPGTATLMTLGLLGTDILLIIFSIKKLIRKEATFLNIFSNIILILVSIVIFIKYMYWALYDYFSIIVVAVLFVFIILLIKLKIKDSVNFKKIINFKTTVVYCLFILLTIPTLFNIQNGPNWIFYPLKYSKKHGIYKCGLNFKYDIINSKAKKIFDLGKEYFNNGQNDICIEYYKKAIEFEPSNPYLHFNLANAYFNNNDLDKELRELDLAIYYNPKFVEAYSNRGLCKSRVGNNYGALDDFNTALAIDSTSYIACGIYINMAYVKLYLDKIEEYNQIKNTIKRLLQKNKEYKDYLHSYYKEYYPNGKLKIEVEIIKGLQNGTLKEYYDNGQLKRLQEWKMGEPLGEHKIFLSTGQLVFHERIEYYESEWGKEKGCFDYYKDSTKDFKVTDRIIINDLKQLNDSIKISPLNRILKFDSSNVVTFKVPNIDFTNYNFKFENATLIKWNFHYCEIKPKSLNNVILRFSAKVNDTIINFDPIEFKVEK